MKIIFMTILTPLLFIFAQNCFEKKLLTNTFENQFYYNIKRMNNITLV